MQQKQHQQQQQQQQRKQQYGDMENTPLAGDVLVPASQSLQLANQLLQILQR